MLKRLWRWMFGEREQRIYFVDICELDSCDNAAEKRMIRLLKPKFFRKTETVLHGGFDTMEGE